MGKGRKPLEQQSGNLTNEEKARKTLEEQVIVTGDEDLQIHQLG